MRPTISNVESVANEHSKEMEGMENFVEGGSRNVECERAIVMTVAKPSTLKPVIR